MKESRRMRTSIILEIPHVSRISRNVSTLVDSYERDCEYSNFSLEMAARVVRTVCARLTLAP